MSNFTWDPNADQTYTDIDGTQIVYVDTLDKMFGYSFTMDSKDNTLTLQLKPEDSQIYTWGKIISSNKVDNKETHISINEGFFNIIGDGRFIPALYTYDDDEFPSGNILVNVSSKSILHIEQLRRVCFSNRMPCAVAVEGEGCLSITDCETVEFLSTLSIADSAVVYCQAGSLNVIPGNNDTCVISSDPRLHKDYKYSFFYSYKDKDPSVLAQLQDMKFTGNSISQIAAGVIVSNNLAINESATVELITDNYNSLTFDKVQKGVFHIGHGSPQLTISPYINKYAFNFFEYIEKQESIPQGMFNFISATGANSGVLKLSTDIANGFGVDVILKGELIYVDDRPATKNDLDFDFWSEKDYMIVRLKNQ